MMINLSKVKYFLYYYRYNILFPGVIGGVILYDISNNKKKRERLLAEKRREAASKISFDWHSVLWSYSYIMPHGAAQIFPSGNWVHRPKTTRISRLILRTCVKFCVPFLGLGFLSYLRSLTYNYTYTSYIGKSISMGHMSQLTHKPLSVEQIDKLKEAQAERRRQQRRTGA